MRMLTSLFLGGALLAGATAPTQAGWHEFWAGFDLHRRRVESWPEPFVIPDRESVREPFRIMADNGWKQQNTLNDEWFTKENHELSHAGKIKLRQLLNEFPPHRRQVFVLEGDTPEVTAARVASVYRFLAEVAPDQPPCSVLTTRIPGPTGAGRYIAGVHRSNALPSRANHAASGSTVPQSNLPSLLNSPVGAAQTSAPPTSGTDSGG